jgi:phosphoheptose isomerase
MLMIAGNGGSAADAQHLPAEFVSRRWRVNCDGLAERIKAARIGAHEVSEKAGS